MRLKTAILAIACLFLVACSPLEQQARNTAAALQGAILAAQTQQQTSCAANPSQESCRVINGAIGAENALITATEAYCGWSVTAPPANVSMDWAGRLPRRSVAACAG